MLSVLLHAFIFIAITCKTNYKLKLEKYGFLNIYTKKIKFVVKLILFYMGISCYITKIFFLKDNGNQTLVSSVVARHLCPCATTRFSKTVLTKWWYISNSINFELIFLKNCWEVRPITLLKYSSGTVLYYKTTLLKSVIHTLRTLLYRALSNILFNLVLLARFTNHCCHPYGIVYIYIYIYMTTENTV